MVQCVPRYELLLDIALLFPKVCVVSLQCFLVVNFYLAVLTRFKPDQAAKNMTKYESRKF